MEEEAGEQGEGEGTKAGAQWEVRRTGLSRMSSEDDGRGHEPRNAGNLEKLEKSRKPFTPRASKNEPAPRIHFRLLTSSIVFL